MLHLLYVVLGLCFLCFFSFSGFSSEESEKEPQKTEKIEEEDVTDEEEEAKEEAPKDKKKDKKKKDKKKKSAKEDINDEEEEAKEEAPKDKKKDKKKKDKKKKSAKEDINDEEEEAKEEAPKDKKKDKKKKDKKKKSAKEDINDEEEEQKEDVDDGEESAVDEIEEPSEAVKKMADAQIIEGNNFIDFSGLPMKASEIHYVLEKLEENKSEKVTLVLAGCSLTLEEVNSIVEFATTHPVALVSLNLNGNRLGDEVVSHIFESLSQMPVLQSLSLAGNNLTDKSLFAFSEIYGKGGITLFFVDLSENSFSDVGAQVVIEMVTNLPGGTDQFNEGIVLSGHGFSEDIMAKIKVLSNGIIRLKDSQPVLNAPIVEGNGAVVVPSNSSPAGALSENPLEKPVM